MSFGRSGRDNDARLRHDAQEPPSGLSGVVDRVLVRQRVRASTTESRSEPGDEVGFNRTANAMGTARQAHRFIGALKRAAAAGRRTTIDEFTGNRAAAASAAEAAEMGGFSTYDTIQSKVAGIQQQALRMDSRGSRQADAVGRAMEQIESRTVSRAASPTSRSGRMDTMQLLQLSQATKDRTEALLRMQAQQESEEDILFSMPRRRGMTFAGSKSVASSPKRVRSPTRNGKQDSGGAFDAALAQETANKLANLLARDSGGSSSSSSSSSSSGNSSSSSGYALGGNVPIRGRPSLGPRNLQRSGTAGESSSIWRKSKMIKRSQSSSLLTLPEIPASRRKTSPVRPAIRKASKSPIAAKARRPHISFAAETEFHDADDAGDDQGGAVRRSISLHANLSEMRRARFANNVAETAPSHEPMAATHPGRPPGVSFSPAPPSSMRKSKSYDSRLARRASRVEAPAGPPLTADLIAERLQRQREREAVSKGKVRPSRDKDRHSPSFAGHRASEAILRPMAASSLTASVLARGKSPAEPPQARAGPSKPSTKRAPLRPGGVPRGKPDQSVARLHEVTRARREELNLRHLENQTNSVLAHILREHG